MKLTQRATTRLILGLCAAVGVVVIAMNATSGRVRSEQSLNLGPASRPAARLLARPLIDPVPAAGLAAAQLMGSSGASPVPAAVSGSGATYPQSTAGASLASSAVSGTSSSSAPSGSPVPPSSQLIPANPAVPAAPSPAPSAPPMAGSAKVRPMVGVGDESPGMFSSQWFRQLPIKIARYGVDWNAAVTRNHTALNNARSWVNAAVADHVEPMVSFGAPPGNAGNVIPTVKVYTAAVQAFIRKFPQVKVYTAWNEPDFIYRKLAQEPGLAASYFNALVGACHGCTIVAGDVYLPANQGLASWLRAYKKGLRFKPSAWAIHPYNDVRSHNPSQTKTLEQFAGGAQIWFDEISGVERRGHWPYPNQSVNGANRDEGYLFSMPKQFHNITRIYHFEWQGVAADHWDSGLLGPNGKPRPAYWTFANAVKGKLP